MEEKEEARSIGGQNENSDAAAKFSGFDWLEIVFVSRLWKIPGNTISGILSRKFR